MQTSRENSKLLANFESGKSIALILSAFLGEESTRSVQFAGSLEQCVKVLKDTNKSAHVIFQHENLWFALTQDTKNVLKLIGGVAERKAFKALLKLLSLKKIKVKPRTPEKISNMPDAVLVMLGVYQCIVKKDHQIESGDLAASAYWLSRGDGLSASFFKYVRDYKKNLPKSDPERQAKLLVESWLTDSSVGGEVSTYRSLLLLYSNPKEAIHSLLLERLADELQNTKETNPLNEALKLYERTINLIPKESERRLRILEKKGNTYVQQSATEAAKQCYKAILKKACVAATKVSVLRHLVSIYRREQHYEKALAYLEDAELMVQQISLDEQERLSARLWDDRGLILKSQGDYHGAQSCFDRALELMRQKDCPSEILLKFYLHRAAVLNALGTDEEQEAAAIDEAKRHALIPRNYFAVAGAAFRLKYRSLSLEPEELLRLWKNVKTNFEKLGQKATMRDQETVATLCYNTAVLLCKRSEHSKKALEVLQEIQELIKLEKLWSETHPIICRFRTLKAQIWLSLARNHNESENAQNTFLQKAINENQALLDLHEKWIRRNELKDYTVFDFGRYRELVEQMADCHRHAEKISLVGQLYKAQGDLFAKHYPTLAWVFYEKAHNVYQYIEFGADRKAYIEILEARLQLLENIELRLMPLRISSIQTLMNAYKNLDNTDKYAELEVKLTKLKKDFESNFGQMDKDMQVALHNAEFRFFQLQTRAVDGEEFLTTLTPRAREYQLSAYLETGFGNLMLQLLHLLDRVYGRFTRKVLKHNIEKVRHLVFPYETIPSNFRRRLMNDGLIQQPSISLAELRKKLCLCLQNSEAQLIIETLIESKHLHKGLFTALSPSAKRGGALKACPETLLTILSKRMESKCQAKKEIIKKDLLGLLRMNFSGYKYVVHCPTLSEIDLKVEEAIQQRYDTNTLDQLRSVDVPAYVIVLVGDPIVQLRIIDPLNQSRPLIIPVEKFFEKEDEIIKIVTPLLEKKHRKSKSETKAMEVWPKRLVNYLIHELVELGLIQDQGEGIFLMMEQDEEVWRTHWESSKPHCVPSSWLPGIFAVVDALQSTAKEEEINTDRLSIDSEEFSNVKACLETAQSFTSKTKQEWRLASLMPTLWFSLLYAVANANKHVKVCPVKISHKLKERRGLLSREISAIEIIYSDPRGLLYPWSFRLALHRWAEVLTAAGITSEGLYTTLIGKGILVRKNKAGSEVNEKCSTEYNTVLHNYYGAQGEGKPDIESINSKLIDARSHFKKRIWKVLKEDFKKKKLEIKVSMEISNQLAGFLLSRVTDAQHIVKESGVRFPILDFMKLALQRVRNIVETLSQSQNLIAPKNLRIDLHRALVALTKPLKVYLPPSQEDLEIVERRLRDELNIAEKSILQIKDLRHCRSTRENLARLLCYQKKIQAAGELWEHAANLWVDNTAYVCFWSDAMERALSYYQLSPHLTDRMLGVLRELGAHYKEWQLWQEAANAYQQAYHTSGIWKDYKSYKSQQKLERHFQTQFSERLGWQLLGLRRNLYRLLQHLLTEKGEAQRIRMIEGLMLQIYYTLDHVMTQYINDLTLHFGASTLPSAEQQAFPCEKEEIDFDGMIERVHQVLRDNIFASAGLTIESFEKEKRNIYEAVADCLNIDVVNLRKDVNDYLKDHPEAIPQEAWSHADTTIHDYQIALSASKSGPVTLDLAVLMEKLRRSIVVLDTMGSIANPNSLLASNNDTSVLIYRNAKGGYDPVRLNNETTVIDVLAKLKDKRSEFDLDRRKELVKQLRILQEFTKLEPDSSSSVLKAPWGTLISGLSQDIQALKQNWWPILHNITDKMKHEKGLNLCEIKESMELLKLFSSYCVVDNKGNQTPIIPLLCIAIERAEQISIQFQQLMQGRTGSSILTKTTLTRLGSSIAHQLLSHEHSVEMEQPGFVSAEKTNPSEAESKCPGIRSRLFTSGEYKTNLQMRIKKFQMDANELIIKYKDDFSIQRIEEQELHIVLPLSLFKNLELLQNVLGEFKICLVNALEDPRLSYRISNNILVITAVSQEKRDAVVKFLKDAGSWFDSEKSLDAKESVKSETVYS